MKALQTEYWVAEYDGHGNPSLTDGSHETYEAAEKTLQQLPISKPEKGRVIGVVEVRTLIQKFIPGTSGDSI
jgi:hypothetical protein